MGIIPLLIFPDESIKYNKNLMRPIIYHPIWFLSTGKGKETEYINLSYKRNIFIGRKYQLFPEKEDLKTIFIKDYLWNIVIISVFPYEFNIYKRFYSQLTLEAILKDYIKSFVKIIKSEILKNDLVQNPKNVRIMNEGDLLKEKIKNLLKAFFFEEHRNLIFLERKKGNIKEMWKNY